jgi:hypothetical protein
MSSYLSILRQQLERLGQERGGARPGGVASDGSGGGAPPPPIPGLPSGWALGQPLTEEQFQRARREQGASVISAQELARLKYKARMDAFRKGRQTRVARDGAAGAATATAGQHAAQGGG